MNGENGPGEVVLNRAKLPFAVASAAILALALALIWFFGVVTTESSLCGVCGRTRTEEWRFGIKTRDEILQNDTSAWVDSVCPVHEKHTWVGISEEQRGWFVTDMVACGGGAEFDYALRAIRRGHDERGQPRTLELFEEYRLICLCT